MSKPSIQFNDYVSLAVMLLMVVALVAGQAGASTYVDENAASFSPIATIESPAANPMDSRISFDFDGHIGDQAMKVSIAVVTDLSHFRGEDE